MNRRLLRWVPALGYAGLIFALSSLSQPNFPSDLFPLRDKGVHIAEYAVLGFLCAFALLEAGQRPNALLWTAMTLSAMYGVSDELHQFFVPGRSSELADVLADAVGSFVGAATYVYGISPSEHFRARRNKG